MSVREPPSVRLAPILVNLLPDGTVKESDIEDKQLKKFRIAVGSRGYPALKALSYHLCTKHVGLYQGITRNRVATNIQSPLDYALEYKSYINAMFLLMKGAKFTYLGEKPTLEKIGEDECEGKYAPWSFRQYLVEMKLAKHICESPTFSETMANQYPTLGLTAIALRCKPGQPIFGDLAKSARGDAYDPKIADIEENHGKIWDNFASWFGEKWKNLSNKEIFKHWFGTKEEGPEEYYGGEYASKSYGGALILVDTLIDKRIPLAIADKLIKCGEIERAKAMVRLGHSSLRVLDAASEAGLWREFAEIMLEDGNMREYLVVEAAKHDDIAFIRRFAKLGGKMGREVLSHAIEENKKDLVRQLMALDTCISNERHIIAVINSNSIKHKYEWVKTLSRRREHSDMEGALKHLIYHVIILEENDLEDTKQYDDLRKVFEYITSKYKVLNYNWALATAIARKSEDWATYFVDKGASGSSLCIMNVLENGDEWLPFLNHFKRVCASDEAVAACLEAGEWSFTRRLISNGSTIGDETWKVVDKHWHLIPYDIRKEVQRQHFSRK